MALAACVVGGACGDDGDGAADDGTLHLFGGTVPAGGPAVDLTPTATSHGRRVVVIGDSITVAAEPLITAASSDIGADVTVLAEENRRITVGNEPAAGTDVLSDVLTESDPDVVVVALGTNDVGKYTTVDEYAAEIDELVAMLPDDQPLVWIDTYLSRLPDGSATFNDALFATLREHGAATIGRWSTIAQHDGMLRDGVHPSEEGTQEFADLVVDEIENWLG